jgi:polar amino acid transport system substrate-binding protein
VKKLALLVAVLLVAITALPSFAGGPVYDELPDLEGREVIIGVENFYTPFQFIDPRAEEPIGFEYDLVEEICERINCVPVYETTTFELQLTGVESGQYDMVMNGLFIFPDREEIYDFSVPYTQSGTYLLVRADEDRFSSLTELAEIAEDQDLIYGAQTGNFNEEIGRSIYSIPEDQIVTYDEFGALITALAQGDIDATAVDAFAGKFVSNTGNTFKLVGDPVVDPIDIALMFTKGSDLTEPFSAAIESMKADGYLDYLLYKWSVDFTPVAE